MAKACTSTEYSSSRVDTPRERGERADNRVSDGKESGPDAYVFGNEVGERLKSMRVEWVEAVEKAGLTGLQKRDLRHEAGSRFMEAA